MPNPFESVARVALEEMVRKHLTPSKYGFFLSEDELENLIDELGAFLVTSRKLQAAGDRLIGAEKAHNEDEQRTKPQPRQRRKVPESLI